MVAFIRSRTVPETNKNDVIWGSTFKNSKHAFKIIIVVIFWTVASKNIKVPSIIYNNAVQCFECVTHALKHSKMVSKSLKYTYFTSNIDFYRSVLFRIIQLIRIRAASSKNQAILAHHINKNHFWTAKYFSLSRTTQKTSASGLGTNESMWVRLFGNRPSYSKPYLIHET